MSTFTRKQPPAVAVIRNDLQALEVMQALVPGFAREAARRDRERQLPHAELEIFSGSGLWGITVPGGYGGADVSAETLVQVVSGVAQADSSLAHIPQNHFYALEVLRVNGTEAQKQRLYAEVLAGARFGNAHAEFATPAAHERTTQLSRDASGYRINGQKFYATGALFADRIPTSVQDADGQTYFAFVHREAPGLTVIDDWSGFGQRTSGSGSVLFSNVPVTADDLVPFQSAFDRPTAVGPFAQILHAAIDLGIARAAWSETLATLNGFPQPVAILPGGDHSPDLVLIGQLGVRLQAAELLLAKAARVLEQARKQPDEQRVARASIAVAKARAITTEVALTASGRLFEVTGSPPAGMPVGFDRHWRNARTHTLHDPVRWKYHAIGNYYLNDTLPPRRGTL